MPDQLQLRGGTTTEHNSFTGVTREVTVDTTKKTLVVHDGSTAGGTPLMKESGNSADVIFNGVSVGKGNNSVTNNTVVGLNALDANVTGDHNTAIGKGSLTENTSGTRNVAIGSNNCLGTNTTGSDLVAIGRQALASNTTANDNTAVGSAALLTNSTGTRNTALGRATLNANSTAHDNTAVGYFALLSNTTGENNVAVGSSALDANTTASNSTAIGTLSLTSQTTGHSNTAVGKEALRSNTTGTNNVAIGQIAGYGITTGISNTIVGSRSGVTLAAGSYNASLGVENFLSGTGSYNTALGYQSQRNATTGNNNTGVGYRAGYSTSSGNSNTFVGYNAGGLVNGGFRNTFIGKSAGDAMTTGDKNVIIGSYGGNEGSLDIRTSDQYIVLSDGDGNPRQITTNTGHTSWTRDLSDSDRANNTNYHAIHNTSNTHPALVVEHSGDSAPNGIFIDFSDADPDNTSQWFIKAEGSTGAERFKVLSNGNTLNANDVFGAISDEKLKEQIKDATSQWNDIKALKIRKYKFKTDVAKGDSDEHWRLGVIAQELETSGMSGLVMDIPDMIENKDGENVESETTTKSVKTSVLHMKAVKALQEAMARIETLEAKVTALENAE